MRNYLLLVAICSSISVFAQIEEVRRITQTLCSPEFHGRGYYQHGDSIAASFLVKEFEKLGVQPFKKQGYLQSFPIEGVNVFDGQAEVTHGTKQLTPGVHFLIDPSSAGIRKELFPVVLDGTKLYKNGGLDEAYLGQVIRELRESKERNAVLVNLSQVTGDTLKSLMGLSEALAEGFPVIEVMFSGEDILDCDDIDLIVNLTPVESHFETNLRIHLFMCRIRFTKKEKSLPLLSMRHFYLRINRKMSSPEFQRRKNVRKQSFLVRITTIWEEWEAKPISQGRMTTLREPRCCLRWHAILKNIHQITTLFSSLLRGKKQDWLARNTLWSTLGSN